MTTNNVREAVLKLVALGAFPSEDDADAELVREHERLYRAIVRPVTNEEAKLLIGVFGDDGYFGLASSILHLIETAPDWPLKECLVDLDNEWVSMLRARAMKGGYSL